MSKINDPSPGSEFNWQQQSHVPFQPIRSEPRPWSFEADRPEPGRKSGLWWKIALGIVLVLLLSAFGLLVIGTMTGIFVIHSGG